MTRRLVVLAPALAVALLAATAARAGDWPRFGFDPARSNAAPASTGITTANVGRLGRQQVVLDGTVDSSPIYLHAATVAGKRRDVFVVTTTYGKTLALDATSGAVLWRYLPPGIEAWQGSFQITTATPVADPERAFVYAASPDGRIHKLALADGREVRDQGWPVTITRDPTHEKIPSALNLVGDLVLATTGGYIGDAPPYQGHVAAIDRRSGRLVHVFNTLCGDRHRLLLPPSCPSVRSAIWARAGVVVEPATGNLLVATGNGPWNGSTDWGDSVLELSPDAGMLLQNYTPVDEAQLEAADADLGSSAPALLTPRLAVQGGKDGKLRLLDLDRLNGRVRSAGRLKGGELQTLPAPGGDALLTTPTVWRSASQVWLFVANGAGTAAYVLRGSLLGPVWQNERPGTSPVLAGGLLYVYDPTGRGLAVYRPGSPRPVAILPAGRGHWNSPIAADGRVALPEGNANDHASAGVLDIYRLPAR